jgi:hypothetical protein
VCERETVVRRGSGSRSCVCEREREKGGRVCLIGKQMNIVSFITEMKTERRPQQTLCVRQRVILVVGVISRKI